MRGIKVKVLRTLQEGQHRIAAIQYNDGTEGVADTNDWNVVTSLLRMGEKPTPRLMMWDDGIWDENKWEE